MAWLDYISWFFGGAFLANTIPHLVAGISGRKFPTAISKPPGVGLSSAPTNAIYGLVNLALAYVLIARVGSFDFRDTTHIIVAGLGFGLMAVGVARFFSRSQGGNSPN